VNYKPKGRSLSLEDEVVRMFFKIKILPRHRQILDYILLNRNRLLTAGFCSLMISAATTAFGYLVKPVIDDIFINQDTTGLLVLPIALMVVFLARGLGRFGQEYYLNYVGEDIIRRLRNQLYDRIQDLPVSFFQKERTGVLMSRITSDVNILKAMVSTVVNGVMRDSFTILGLTGVIFYQNWRMAIIAFIVLPAAYYPIFKIGRSVRRIRTLYQAAMAEMNAFLHETLAGNKIVKAFGMERHEKERFFAKTGDLFGLEIKSVRVRSLVSPLMEILGGVGISFVIWYGGWEVIKGLTTPGTFTSFLTCVVLLYEPVKKLSVLNNAAQEGLASVDRIYEIIEATSDIQDPQAPMVMQPGGHTVKFENVYFHYDDKPVLNGIDIHIPKGEILALVGTSGGGKSTIANLIPRFFDVDHGRIAIDGIDIRNFRVADLRREIAIVTQDPILFNETVRDNIAYGNPQATPDDIIQAARAAFAHDFIQSFSKGYDTTIGELGGKLSGGEKQRICIARALLKNTPILILDEATSSLDSESEALVQKALENLMQGRTTLVIAHRLSTVVNANQIAVVVKGRIVEQGTHQNLLDAKGEYAKLYEMQFGVSNEIVTQAEMQPHGKRIPRQE
jgi:subfamily B ATP-binding cassette protein MsbA